MDIILEEFASKHNLNDRQIKFLTLATAHRRLCPDEPGREPHFTTYESGMPKNMLKPKISTWIGTPWLCDYCKSDKEYKDTELHCDLCQAPIEDGNAHYTCEATHVTRCVCLMCKKHCNDSKLSYVEPGWMTTLNARFERWLKMKPSVQQNLGLPVPEGACGLYASAWEFYQLDSRNDPSNHKSYELTQRLNEHPVCAGIWKNLKDLWYHCNGQELVPLEHLPDIWDIHKHDMQVTRDSVRVKIRLEDIAYYIIVTIDKQDGLRDLIELAPVYFTPP